MLDLLLVYKVSLILIFALFNLFSAGQQAVTTKVNSGIKFTENAGQWQSTILFRAGLDGGALFLEQDKLTFHFYDKKKSRQFHFSRPLQDKTIDAKIAAHAFAMSFDNCNKNCAIEKLQKGSYYENFFIGDDKTKWKGEVSNYHQLFYRNIYDGIDYEILTAGDKIKYNFHVKPGANTNNIKLKYEGIKNIQLQNGTLIIKPDVNELFEQKPYAYQIIEGTLKEVPCNFVLKNKTVSYEFPKGYDKKYELVIDPLLVFAAQSGSTADNFGMTATYDPYGNLYSGGTIFDIGYPTTFGAYSSSFFGPDYYGNTDVVITKYNSTGTNLIYSTYFGGSNSESINSLIVDKNNNLCLYGATSSINMPTTTGTYDNTFNGGNFVMFVNNGLRYNKGTDIYIAKFSTGGSVLLGCTYVGGSNNDGINQSDSYNYWIVPPVPPDPIQDTVAEPRYDSLQFNYGDQSRGEIQIDAQNNIYIASSTRSSNFPTINGFDNTLGGKQDGVIFKLNSSLTSLLYSSFVGGSSTDAGYGVIVENNLEAFVTGGTTSNDLSFTGGGYQPTYQGGKADGFILRVNAAGNAILNGTYYGTPEYDQSYFIQSDKVGNIYIYGQSLGNMPIVPSASSPTVFSVPKTHQFISKFDKTLTTLKMSTVFGSDTNYIDLSPSAFAVDKCSNIYLSGWGPDLLKNLPPMSGMPLLNATQSTTDGHDFYFMGLDSNAATLKYGSYFGGGLSREHVDGGTSRFDPHGKIYQSVCAGCWGNDDFPVTPGAWPGTPGDPNHCSLCNNGVVKMDFQLLLAVSTINTNTLSGCEPLTVNFTNATPGDSYTWYFGNGDSTSTILNPAVTYTNPGTYTVSLVVLNPNACNIKDSAITYITVLPRPVSSFSLNYSPCSNTITTINNSTGTLTANPYLWNWGDATVTSTLTAPSHTYASNGTFTISLLTTGLNGCTAKSSQTVSVLNFIPTVILPDTICRGFTVNLNASGGTNYTWTPGASLSNSLIASPIASPSATTIYTVVIVNNTSGFPCTDTLTTRIVVNPKITSAFTYSIGACNNNVQFTDGSFVAPTNWQWNFGDGNGSGNQNPLHFYGTAGTYTTTLISSNGFECKDTVVQTISLPAFPPIAVSSFTTKCEADTVQLNASGGDYYLWTPSATLSNPNIPNPFAFPTISTIYTVTIGNITGTDTCKSLLTTTVNINQVAYNTSSITVSANPIVLGQSAVVTLNGFALTGSVTVVPATNVSVQSNTTIIITPTKPGEYTIYFTEPSGCIHILKTIYVEIVADECTEALIYLPTGFTPNGDGVNDMLFVRSNFLSEIYLTIYDRWGEKVFETNDLKIGWDGRYKGKQLDQGVYGYYLTFKCNNGKESFKKGNITLMR